MQIAADSRIRIIRGAAIPGTGSDVIASSILHVMQAGFSSGASMNADKPHPAVSELPPSV